MFGDNRSVVTSSTIPNSTISKRHHLASYHRVREAIAAKYISFHWKDGKSSPADILSKHWEFATVWPMLKPIVFWRGKTATQLKGVTEFRQPLQVQIHLEMPGILVQLGHIQRTKKLAPQIDLKRSPTWSLRRYQAICPLSERDGRYGCQVSRAQRAHSRP